MYKVVKVNIAGLRDIVAQGNRIAYKWGAKAHPRDSLAEIRQLDCSGFTSLASRLYFEGFILQAGSWLQHQQCAKAGFKPTNPAYAGLTDGRLRILFINPKNTAAGHVWFAFNGRTLECYGGHGVGSRKWNTSALRKPDACYVLTESLEVD